ncbi:hypothetical protein SAMN05421847_2054 [Halpernia humi]|uniref:Uncharacterized protein n=1 Tax=Halpernia humi TaxID=493375 RepID=A0A1H5ZAC3_9FLAO|nr:hypothetical protein [Halpernia humi]SEG33014.1 hypothetical protein SAMN05421847_2054 [Halpernia humi]
MDNPNLHEKTNEIEGYFSHFENHLDLHLDLILKYKINYFKRYVYFSTENEVFFSHKVHPIIYGKMMRKTYL